MEPMVSHGWRVRRRAARRNYEGVEVRKEMEYKRLKNQLRIHWFWLKKNEDFEEVYKTLKIWIDIDVEKKPSREVNLLLCASKVSSLPQLFSNFFYFMIRIN